MRCSRFLALLLAVAVVPVFVRAQVAPARALVFIGLTSNDAQAFRLQAQAGGIRAGLVARGFEPGAIQVLPAGSQGPLRRETILDALAATPPATPETWIILLGTIAPGRHAEASFQVSGPRLGAADFAAAVAQVPGVKFVVAATAGGGGFLPALLEVPGVEAVAATAVQGEVNEPRFAGYWAEALAAHPRASFAELAAKAADRVEIFYRESQIAQGEHAHGLDRPGRRIVAVAEGFASTAERAAPASPPAAASASDLVIPKPAGDTELERRPATAETRGLIDSARQAAARLEDAALVLALRAEITVASDRSVTERWTTRTFVRSAEAVDDVATLNLPHAPPLVLARIEAARVIRPDGGQLLVNPRPLEARAAAGREENNRARRFMAPTAIELPEVTAGCIVESTWLLERKAEHDIPELYQEWRFAGKFPVRSVQVRLQLPDAAAWRFFSRGFPPESPAGEGRGRTVTWTLADLPALEPAPAGPPLRESTPWVGVSSLGSWEGFADWYRRLAAGSEETGPEVEALAAQIARDHAGRPARLRAAYEAVAALRYVAIELGVGAFRARTPEQVWRQRHGDCKDKANLLAALLRRLGIDAELALINRFDTTFTDFPGWQFNHALVRVPAAPADGQAADLWLDATDRLVPFGVVAPGDAYRPALAFPAAAAARFVEVVPAQEPPAVWRETWQLSAGPAGTLPGGTVTLSADGFAEAVLRRMFTDLTPARRLARVHELLGVSTLTIGRVSATDAYDLAVPFRLEATVSGVAPGAIAPRPPLLAALLAAPTRSVALLPAEGRPSRYVQEISFPEAAAPSPVPTRAEKSGTAGFLFQATRRAGFRAVEISLPGTLAPGDYPAARAAWLGFLQSSLIHP